MFSWQLTQVSQGQKMIQSFKNKKDMALIIETLRCNLSSSRYDYRSYLVRSFHTTKSGRGEEQDDIH